MLKEEDDASTWLLEHEKENHQSIEPPPLWFSKRLLVSIVLFFCYVASALIRDNVNMALVEMTSNKSFTLGGTTITTPGEFHWDSATLDLMLSSFSYGALFSFLGSVPINKLGCSVSCSVFFLMMGIITLLEPGMLHVNLCLFLGCRIVAGICEAFFNVSVAEIYSKWIPYRERCTLISHIFNGTNVGAAVSTTILGFLARKFGWEMVFYFTGVASVILSISCFVLVKNQPNFDRGISKKELIYIRSETVVNGTRKNVVHPYKRILSSSPIWALLIARFIVSWVPTLSNEYFPIYVKDLVHTDKIGIGLVFSLPTSASIVICPLTGILLDYCKTHTNMTTTQIHKIFLSSILITSSFLFAAIALTSDFALSMGILSLVRLLVSPADLILEITTVNIAPNDTSVIAGLGTFSKALSIILSRPIIAFMIMNHSLQEWNNCFLMIATFLFFGAITFLLYGSSEAQSWSLQRLDDEDDH